MFFINVIYLHFEFLASITLEKRHFVMFMTSLLVSCFFFSCIFWEPFGCFIVAGLFFGTWLKIFQVTDPGSVFIMALCYFTACRICLTRSKVSIISIVGAFTDARTDFIPDHAYSVLVFNFVPLRFLWIL